MGTVSWSFCLQAMTFLCILAIAHGQCARFEFPTLGDSHDHNVVVGSQLNLPFALDTSKCRFNAETYTITVGKLDNKHNITHDVCKMLIARSGKCFSFRPEECMCAEETGQFSLSKVVDKSDETVWKWKVSNEHIAMEREIRFVLTDGQPKDQKALHAGVTVSVLIVIIICTAVIVLIKRRQCQVKRRPTIDAVWYRAEHPSVPDDGDSSNDLQPNVYVAMADDGTCRSTGNKSKASSKASLDFDNTRSVYLSLRRTACPEEGNGDEDNTRTVVCSHFNYSSCLLSIYQPLIPIACPEEGSEPDGCPYTIPGFGEEGVPAPTDAPEAVVHPAPDNDDEEYLAIIA
ncbi:uncharacterized protein [Littorina saxatilis]|uniref:uncharacterized protein n=1 Tax=Littorina saxatilis TaxID=31220 RepID=UPI0038B51F4A